MTMTRDEGHDNDRDKDELWGIMCLRIAVSILV
jgi:hypothetical protein